AALTEFTPMQRRYIEMLQSSARSLMTIIEEILDVSKIEAGKLELEQVPFSLRKTIADSLSLLAILAHQKKLELSSMVAPDVPDWVMGDPMRLRLIITNLVTNAIKFTERGEVLLEARLTSSGPPQLHIQVKDTGIGIPKEKHGKIFEAFSRADPSTTRKYGGTWPCVGMASQLTQIVGGLAGC